MILETERLILRPFTESDAADAYEYLHEPMVHCFACMKTETIEDARKAVLDRAKDGEYYFAITLKENGKAIGEIDAMPETHAPDEENAVLDTFSPCWMLNRGKVPFCCAAWCNVKSVRNAIKSGFRPAWVEMTAKSFDVVDGMNK